MLAQRRIGTLGSLAFLNAFLLASAVPAYAQIELVVVTAQKKAEDIQTVPIAITAFTADDLTAHQINSFNDLQFSVPGVTYTKSNFTGSDFEIRGIGDSAVGVSADDGVATNINDVYLNVAGTGRNRIFRHRTGRSLARPAEYLVRTQCHRRRDERHHRETGH